MKYTCLVCGYSELEENPFDGKQFHSTHEICPSCGFHYGYDDLNGTAEYPEDYDEFKIIQAYRRKWISNGMKWKHDYADDSFPENHPPKNWNPREQLKNIPKQFLDPGENY